MIFQRHGSVLKFSIAAAVVVGWIGGRVSAVTYTAVDLHPAGYQQSNANGACGAIQAGVGSVDGLWERALVWSGTAGGFVDLNPAGFSGSHAECATDAQQAGYAVDAFYNSHAMLWSGTAASAVDLSPSEYSQTNVTGISGARQAGYGKCIAASAAWHALVWSGTAASAVDLNPAGYSSSQIWGVYGDRQVGWGCQESSGNKHALIWNDTAASAADLHPGGYSQSWANGICGNQQVGVADGHAIVWNCTAASAVKLDPSGYTGGIANGSNGTQQAGSGTLTINVVRAFVWSGTAGSAVNLHQFLPAGFAGGSVAKSIDALGNVAGYAINASGQQHAFLWVPNLETFTWQGAGSGPYNAASNWTDNFIPNGAFATAKFTGGDAPRAIGLDSPIVLGSLVFDSAQPHVLTADSSFASLTLHARSGDARIEALAGSHRVETPAILESDAVVAGPGTIEFSAGIRGPHSLTVHGTLNASSIEVDAIVIGSQGAAAVPEPSGIALLGVGVLGLFAWFYRRNRKAG